MPILSYDSYSLPAFEGELPHTSTSGKVFAGIERMIINRSDLQSANYGAFNPGNLIPYGRFVFRQPASADGGVNVALCSNSVIPNTAILGVAVSSDIYEKKQLSSHNNAPINSNIQLFAGYAVQEPVTILRQGLVWVFSETALAVNAPIFVRCTTPTANTNQAFGRVRNAAASANDAALTAAQAVVVRPNTVATGGFALIDITLSTNSLT